MQTRTLVWGSLIFVGLSIGSGLAWLSQLKNPHVLVSSNAESRLGALMATATPATVPTASPKPAVATPGSRTVLNLPAHYFQTFNNCGPATLAMTLSYFQIDVTQQQLGNQLRPYQNSAGDNDDKSVTLPELAAKAEEFGLVAYHRPAGSIELLQKMTANGIPVITRTWTSVDEDIGHYRVVTGFDQNRGVVIQDDSLQGEELSFDDQDFLKMWEKFNYEFLIVVPEDKSAVAEAILGPLVDTDYAWQKAVSISETVLDDQPSDIPAGFNLSVARYHLGDYAGSVAAFESVEQRLSFRTLWYQTEPFWAYYELGQHQEALSRIDQILNNGNRAYSELYYLRGQIYLQQGESDRARQEFELALRYHEEYRPAERALAEL